MELLVNAAVGLLGTIVGAAIAWLAGTRQARAAATFELHREFNSLTMIASRYQASELLEHHRGKDYTQLRQSLGRVKMQDVWNVMYFYQRLWLAIRHGHVDRRYVPELFGDHFYWWWEHSFEDQLVQPTEPAQHIQALKHWLEAHTTPSDRSRWRISHEAWAGRYRTPADEGREVIEEGSDPPPS